MASSTCSCRVSMLAFFVALPLPCHATFKDPSAALALPDVETVLSKAKGKADDFAEQARAMQARVEEEQAKSRAALKKAKDDYEKKLSDQATENTKIEEQSTSLNNDIGVLKLQNAKLSDEAKTYTEANNAMRNVMNSMLLKVEAADSFIKDSLANTDDAAAPELAVLVPTTQKPTLDHFLRVAQGGSELSLLQFEAARKEHAHDSKPEDLVQVLSLGLVGIATAEKEGAAQLKASFMENFAAGQKRKDELLSIQKSLLEEKSRLNSTQLQLIAARDHVKDTFLQLGKRLHGLRLFARKIDALAASALKDTVVDNQHSNGSAPVKQTPTTTTTTTSAATTATATTAAATTMAAATTVSVSPLSASTTQPPMEKKRRQHEPRQALSKGVVFNSFPLEAGEGSANKLRGKFGKEAGVAGLKPAKLSTTEEKVSQARPPAKPKAQAKPPAALVDVDTKKATTREAEVATRAVKPAVRGGSAKKGIAKSETGVKAAHGAQSPNKGSKATSSKAIAGEARGKGAHEGLKKQQSIALLQSEAQPAPAAGAGSQFSTVLNFLGWR